MAMLSGSETLYPRDRNQEINDMIAIHPEVSHPIKRRLKFWGHKLPDRHLLAVDFVRGLQMYVDDESAVFTRF